MGAASSREQQSGNANHPLHRNVLGPRPSNPYLAYSGSVAPSRGMRDLRPIEYRPPVQQSEIVRNVVSLSKGTLRLERVDEASNIYVITFEFDAEVEGWITIFYRAKEVVTRDGDGEAAAVVKVGYRGKGDTLPVKTRFEKGKGQTYRQKAEKGLDVRGWANAELKYREGGDRYPIVVRLEAAYPDEWQVPERLRVKSHTTFAEVVETKGGQGLELTVIAQKVLVGDTIHRLFDLYGIGAAPVTAKKDNEEDWMIDGVHECVICLTEPCNTAVLPCNHFCLCDDCARVLSNETDWQRRKCPVCRTQLGSLLKIISSIKEGSEGESTVEGASNAEVGSTVTGGNVIGEVVSRTEPEVPLGALKEEGGEDNGVPRASSSRPQTTDSTQPNEGNTAAFQPSTSV